MGGSERLFGRDQASPVTILGAPIFLVLGNVAVDEFMAAPAWPAPGATVLVGAPWRDLGGKGANQAMILRRCGADLRFVATIGDDPDGDWIAANLAAESLPPDHLIRLAGSRSDRSLIFVGADGENAIASTSICSDALTAAHAAEAIAAAAPGHILMLQGGLTVATTRAACLAARQRGMRIIFNASAMRDGYAALVPLVHVLVVNALEAAEMAGQGSPAELAEKLRAAGAATAIVTLGANGAVAASPDGPMIVPASPATVRDTTGAGDTYLGVLAACLFDRHLSLPQAMQRAGAAAAITVSRQGARSAFPTGQELAANLRGS